MAVLNPEAEHARISRELQGLQAEMLRIKHAHPGLTDAELTQKLYAHPSLRADVVAVVKDALRLSEVLNAMHGTTGQGDCSPVNRQH